RARPLEDEVAARARLLLDVRELVRARRIGRQVVEPGDGACAVPERGMARHVADPLAPEVHLAPVPKPLEVLRARLQHSPTLHALPAPRYRRRMKQELEFFDVAALPWEPIEGSPGLAERILSGEKG